nr:MAG TPA: hypothetical protein [Caudoviricetes sp.]
MKNEQRNTRRAVRPAGYCSLCVVFVLGSIALDDDSGIVWVRLCAFFGDAVKQADGEALLIQRAGVTVIVNNGYNWRLRQRFVVLPIFVVHIGHAIPPYNIAVLGLGGAHCINGLLFGQTIERQPRPVAKCANDAPRSKKFGFTHKNTSILNI